MIAYRVKRIWNNRYRSHYTIKKQSFKSLFSYWKMQGCKQNSTIRIWSPFHQYNKTTLRNNGQSRHRAAGNGRGKVSKNTKTKPSELHSGSEMMLKYWRGKKKCLWPSKPIYCHCAHCESFSIKTPGSLFLFANFTGVLIGSISFAAWLSRSQLDLKTVTCYALQEISIGL